MTCRIIRDISEQICVASVKINRVGLEEPPELCRIGSCAVVVEARLSVTFAGGEQEAGLRGGDDLVGTVFCGDLAPHVVGVSFYCGASVAGEEDDIAEPVLVVERGCSVAVDLSEGSVDTGFADGAAGCGGGHVVFFELVGAEVEEERFGAVDVFDGAVTACVAPVGCCGVGDGIDGADEVALGVVGECPITHLSEVASGGVGHCRDGRNADILVDRIGRVGCIAASSDFRDSISHFVILPFGGGGGIL